MDVLHLLFKSLSAPDQLLLALSSPLLYNAYLSTSPKIPSLWTEIRPHPDLLLTQYPAPENYPHRCNTDICRPLGALIQVWINPKKYRSVRFSDEQKKQSIEWSLAKKVELPPYFIERGWKDAKIWFHQDESSTFKRWAIYHACYRYAGDNAGLVADVGSSSLSPLQSAISSSRDMELAIGQNEDTEIMLSNLRRYVLPHPRGKNGITWCCEVKKTIEEDRKKWKTWRDWENWWLDYHWTELPSSMKSYTDDLVKDGLKIAEMTTFG